MSERINPPPLPGLMAPGCLRRRSFRTPERSRRARRCFRSALGFLPLHAYISRSPSRSCSCCCYCCIAAKKKQVLRNVKVEYEVLPGWDEDISECKQWDDLPANARAYVRRVEVSAREARAGFCVCVGLFL